MPSQPVDRVLPPVSRGQNVLLVLPHDRASIPQALAPLVERAGAPATAVQLVVVTPDAESAALAAATAAGLAGDRALGVLAATSPARASRMAKLAPPQLISGTPTTLLAMLRAAAIKLEEVQAVCVLWADELSPRDETPALEALMAEIPKDAARTIVASVLTSDVEALVERYARRARREVATVPEPREPIALEYVLVSTTARATALRRLLDELDPASAIVFTRSTEDAPAVRRQLRALGYPDEGAVSVGTVAPPDTALIVLYDLPASHEELREAVAGAARRVALIQPRQLESLRVLALGGRLEPHALPESLGAARERTEEALAQLRKVLDAGGAPRELLSLEPLLDSYDGAEIAAAALKMLEHERAAQAARAAKARVAAPDAAPREPAERMASLFVSVGTRDGVRPADLVGLLANKGGVAGAEIGRVDVRESHSTVEVPARVVDQIIERASGSSVKGRRALIKPDERPGGGAARGRGRDRDDTRRGRPDDFRRGTGREGARRGRPDDARRGRTDDTRRGRPDDARRGRDEPRRGRPRRPDRESPRE